MPDRGVSEVLGFVLVFSLIAASVGTVYVVGFSGLQNARDAEQISNAERAFDVLADNIEDIVRSDAPNRATEFRLYESDLYIGDSTKLRVEITNVGSPAPVYSVSTFPIVYEASGSPTTIRYVGGTVIREDRGGAILQSNPPFVFTERGSERTAVLPLVELRPRGQQAVGGSGTVLIRAERALAETLTSRTSASTGDDPDNDGRDEYTISLRVETSASRAPVWRDYLNTELDEAYGVSSACSLPSADVVECTFFVERLYVTATRIDVSIAN